MTLLLQIKSLFFVFIYALFFSFTFNTNKKFLLHKNKLYKIIINVLFFLDHVLLFFILLKEINNFILHFYYVPSFILGIILYKKYFTSDKKSI